jgi:hypothetical protein
VGTRILLLIETVDASGSRTSAMIVPVPGDLSPGSHRYFTTQVPSATERYRVSVYAVDRRIGGP